MRIVKDLRNKAWFRRLSRFLKQVADQDVWYSPQIRVNTVRLGDWCFKPDNFSSGSIVYSLGAGQDIVLDTALMS